MEKTDYPSIRIYVNKIENKITFKIRRLYYFELLTLETMKLLKSTEKIVDKNKNSGTFFIQKSLKWYQFIVILLTTLINMVQES